MRTEPSPAPRDFCPERLVGSGHMNLPRHSGPRHVAIVMDGNRRWARRRGFGDPSAGHRYGAEHPEKVLGWCAELGIGCVTVFVASSDNLRKRDPAEVAGLMRLVETVVADRLARPSSPWRLHVAGRLDGLPGSTREALRR